MNSLKNVDTQTTAKVDSFNDTPCITTQKSDSSRACDTIRLYDQNQEQEQTAFVSNAIHPIGWGDNYTNKSFALIVLELVLAAMKELGEQWNNQPT